MGGRVTVDDDMKPGPRPSTGGYWVVVNKEAAVEGPVGTDERRTVRRSLASTIPPWLFNTWEGARIQAYLAPFFKRFQSQRNGIGLNTHIRWGTISSLILANLAAVIGASVGWEVSTFAV